MACTAPLLAPGVWVSAGVDRRPMSAGGRRRCCLAARIGQAERGSILDLVWSLVAGAADRGGALIARRIFLGPEESLRGISVCRGRRLPDHSAGQHRMERPRTLVGKIQPVR